MTLSERFEILGELGQGGMASVKLVRDRETGRESALKILHPHLTRQPAARARLRRELAIIEQLDHPAILPVQGLIETDDALALQLRQQVADVRQRVDQRTRVDSDGAGIFEERSRGRKRQRWEGRQGSQRVGDDH